jgi:hypothetical protein
MAKTANTIAAKANKPAKPAVTFERAKLLCPNVQIAEKISQSFGLDLPEYEEIRDAHERAVRQTFLAFGDALNDKATSMHFQRLVGSIVASACSAGSFYSQKVTEARDLTSKLANDYRDEDRDAPAGFDSKAQKARKFAAEMAIQAYALLAAADGAVKAYEEVTGETWKPYVASAQGVQTVERKSAETEMSAFAH